MKKPKYYTAFVFSDHEGEHEIHCTHKYFGTMTETALELVVSRIDMHRPFGRNGLEGRDPFRFPEIKFTERAFFGPGGNIPVLLPSTPVSWPFPWALLRERLAAFGGKDDYAYRPHVTSERESITEPIVGYALMSGKKVIKLWK